jgi:hypothetical protein
MARPIEPTPVLTGDAADKLLQELDNVCDQSETKRRIDWARALLALSGSARGQRPTGT